MSLQINKLRAKQCFEVMSGKLYFYRNKYCLLGKLSMWFGVSVQNKFWF